MTNRERISAALSHRQPDKVPYDVRFTCKAREAMARYLHDPAFSDKIGNCFSFLRPGQPVPAGARGALGG